MDPGLIEGLLKAIKEAVTSRRQNDDDVALPSFDPATSDNGAEHWCDHIETLSKEFGWSSIATVAKAGKALKGSAILWFESWDPTSGRSWENFRHDITDLYPEKKNLCEKLSTAVLYNSESAETYCEYAREKLRLLRNTKVAFKESQLIELICGSISDVNVRMASFNSSVKTTSELISLFTSYSKIRKRPLDLNNRDCIPGPSGIKRPRPESRSNGGRFEKTCFQCGQSGHFKYQCSNPVPNPHQVDPSKTQVLKKYCSICKRAGHLEAACFFNKPSNGSSSSIHKPSNGSPSSIPKDVNFLENPN